MVDLLLIYFLWLWWKFSGTSIFGIIKIKFPTKFSLVQTFFGSKIWLDQQYFFNKEIFNVRFKVPSNKISPPIISFLSLTFKTSKCQTFGFQTLFQCWLKSFLKSNLFVIKFRLVQIWPNQCWNLTLVQPSLLNILTMQMRHDHNHNTYK